MFLSSRSNQKQFNWLFLRNRRLHCFHKEHLSIANVHLYNNKQTKQATVFRSVIPTREHIVVFLICICTVIFRFLYKFLGNLNDITPVSTKNLIVHSNSLPLKL